MVDQEKVIRLFFYNPDTGIFTRKITNNKKLKVGEVAGSLHKLGYVEIKIDGVNYKAHRLAWLYMTGSFPKEFIDHIDGVRNNNKWINLREATRSENNRNSGLRKDNKSGFKGVFFDNHNNKWVAMCWANGSQKKLGFFKTAIDASKAYCDFAKVHHGEFFKEFA